MARSVASASARKGAPPVPLSPASSASKTSKTLLSYFSAVPAPSQRASSSAASSPAPRTNAAAARAHAKPQQPTKARSASARPHSAKSQPKTALARSQSAATGEQATQSAKAPQDKDMGNRPSAPLRPAASANAVLTTISATPPRQQSAEQPSDKLELERQRESLPRPTRKEQPSTSPRNTSAQIKALSPPIIVGRSSEPVADEASPVAGPSRLASDSSSVVDDSQDITLNAIGLSSPPLAPELTMKESTSRVASFQSSPVKGNTAESSMQNKQTAGQTSRPFVDLKSATSERASPGHSVSRDRSLSNAKKSPAKAAETSPTKKTLRARATSNASDAKSPSKAPRRADAPRTPSRDTSTARDVFGSASSSPLTPLPSSPASPRTVGDGSPLKKLPHSFSLVIPIRTRTVSIEPKRKTPKKVQLDPVFSDSDEDDDDLPRNKMQVDASPSPSTPDDHKATRGGESDEEDRDEDDLAELMARAKGRIAQGTALTTPIAADIAALTQEATKDEAGGGGRKRTSTRRGSTTKLEDDKRYRAKLPQLQRSQAIERITKERRQGKSGNWEYAMQIIKSTSDDESDGSDAEQGANVPALTSDKLEVLVRVAGEVVEDDDAEYAAYAASPQKRQQQGEANQLANNIADALKFDLSKQGANDGKHRNERKVWRSRVQVPGWRDGAEMALAPWTQALERIILAGRADPRQFPPALTMWAKFRKDATNTYTPEFQAARAPAAQRLVTFALHPDTADFAANRAMAVLERMLLHSSTSNTSILPLRHVQSALHDIGMREELLHCTATDVERMSTPMPHTQGASQQWLTKEDRDAVLARLLRIVRALADTGLQGYSARDSAILFSMLMSCGLEPESVCHRKAIEGILDVILNVRGAPRSSEKEHATFQQLVTNYKGAPASIRFETLSALPNTTTNDNLFRRGLALAYLEPKTANVEDSSMPDDASSHIRRLTRLLQDGVGPFDASQDSDDVSLYYHALILSVALSDMSESINNQKEGALLDEFVQALDRAQDKIRADVRSGEPIRQRAKNVLNRVAYSIVYRRRTARGIVAGIDFGDDADDKRVNKKMKVTAAPFGQSRQQMTLDGFVQRPPAEAQIAQAADT
ncbi:hypothetical protein ACM66B_000399 [Microbotryomycetes sp. NB124-2]